MTGVKNGTNKVNNYWSTVPTDKRLEVSNANIQVTLSTPRTSTTWKNQSTNASSWAPQDIFREQSHSRNSVKLLLGTIRVPFFPGFP